MTFPPAPALPRTPWYVRPEIVLPGLAAVVIATALVAPEPSQGRSGDGRLTTYSTKAMGAGMFYEIAERLGWRVDRRKAARPPDGADVIHAVLDPSVQLRMTDAHELLERVRGGAALLVVLGRGTGPLSDSLRVGSDTGGYHLPPPSAGAERCADPPRSLLSLWPDSRVHLYHLRFRGPPPDGAVNFLRVDSVARHVGVTRRIVYRDSLWAATGFPYGRGRIVVGSDPDILRNDAIRVCAYDLDVPAVRILEYLRDGGATPRTRLVFDEYHHGYGPQPGTLHAAASYLGGTPSGHLFIQLVGAALVLLLAVAPRVIAPRDPARIERRSPLEHVDALARAYAQVGATRTATGRLVRGVRRRVEHGTVHARSGLTDAAFLDRAAQLGGAALAPDIALIRRALAAQLSRREFADVGAALHRLETSLTRI